MAVDLFHEPSGSAVGSPTHGPVESTINSRYSSKFEATMCEVYVTLGRLSHVKVRHEEDARKMQAMINERVKGALVSAHDKIRGEYEALLETLDRLYERSVADLEAHKLVLDGPSRARVGLLESQKVTVEKVENSLKALSVNPNQDVVLRELPEVTRIVNRVLKSSLKLIGLTFPEAGPLTANDFPSGRLHNLIIAPKRSGDRGKKFPFLPPPSVPSGIPPSTHSSAAEQKQPSFDDVGGNEKATTPQNPVEAVVCGVVEDFETPARERTGGCFEGKAPERSRNEVRSNKCCRWEGRRVTAGWAEKGEHAVVETHPGKQEEGHGEGPEGAACSHCACACRSDDVWAAYGALRKRYNALKKQADVEEARLKMEECRREMQSEFDTRREALEKKLGQERGKMETGINKMQADMQTLRGVVQESIKECQAAKNESAELREKVRLGEECMKEALQEALTMREEITKRKQHGQILLARIRFIQGQTTSFVDHSNSISTAAGSNRGTTVTGGGLFVGDGGAGAPSSSSCSPSPEKSDYGSDSDIEEIIRDRQQNNKSISGGSSSNNSNSNKNNHNSRAARDANSKAHVTFPSLSSLSSTSRCLPLRRSTAASSSSRRSGGGIISIISSSTSSSTNSIVSTSSTSVIGDDDSDADFGIEEPNLEEDENDDGEIGAEGGKRKVGAGSWIDTGKYGRPTVSKRGLGRGRTASNKRDLERQRKDLSSELIKLSAELAASGITVDGSNLSDDEGSIRTNPADFNPRAAAAAERRSRSPAGSGNHSRFDITTSWRSLSPGEVEEEEVFRRHRSMPAGTNSDNLGLGWESLRKQQQQPQQQRQQPQQQQQQPLHPRYQQRPQPQQQQQQRHQSLGRPGNECSTASLPRQQQGQPQQERRDAVRRTKSLSRFNNGGGRGRWLGAFSRGNTSNDNDGQGLEKEVKKVGPIKSSRWGFSFIDSVSSKKSFRW